MIETDRFVLRPFELSDIDIVFKIYSDAEIMEYLPVPVMDFDTAQRHLDRIIACWKAIPQVNYEFAVVDKQTNEKIGRAEITRNYPERSVMIGWILLKSAWGRGYATQIAKALIEHCFCKLNVHRVYARCHPDNIGSWRVMEKCGMRREARYIKKCRYEKSDGIRWEDEFEYAILDSEFSKKFDLDGIE